MQLIEKDSGLALKFSCQSCDQLIELLVEPRLFQCPACSQKYRLKNEEGEISVKNPNLPKFTPIISW